MSLISIIDKWNKGRQAALIQSYNSEGLRASGRWANSLDGSTTQNENIVKTVIKGERYTGALVGGRKATSASSGGAITLRQAIREWIDNKGIIPRDGISKNSLAFIISRKIHREGITVPNAYNSGKLISNAINTQSLNDLSESVKEFLATMVKTEVLTAIKQ